MSTDLLPHLRSAVHHRHFQSIWQFIVFWHPKNETKTCNLPPVMMVSVLALAMEVSNGWMVTLSSNLTASSNDLISRGLVAMSVLM